MTKTLFTIIAFALVTYGLRAQEFHQQIIKGQVVAAASDIGGIGVFNLKNNNSTLTNNKGCFSITASVSDTLVFSSILFKQVKLKITSDKLVDNVVLVEMFPLMNPLKEVMVFQHKNINAVALGIIPKGQKSYTADERKLNAASSGHFNPMGLDSFLNLLTGRTAMLKKELAVETNEIALQLLTTLFEEDFFTITLRIPAEYVKGFQYYIVENTSFVSALKSKNKLTATFLISELAINYNKTISHEK